MAKLIDLTGQRFGKLVVIGRDMSRTNKGTYWLCQCDCGKVVSARKDQLTRPTGPRKTSCGCDVAEKSSKANLKDETGKVYGKLTVLKRVANRPGASAARWLCQCECGNTCEVDGGHLRDGSVQSCGCKRYESHNMIDETGNRYGRLTVLARSDKTDGTHVFWLCKCDCGNLCETSGSRLRDGKTLSCGCYAREKSSEIHRVDKIGKRYGKLVVIECDEERTKKEKRVYWKCQCDCGNTTSVLSANLETGSVKSCGCLKSRGEETIARLLSENNIPFQKEFTFSDLRGEGGNPLRFDFGVFNQDGSLSHLIEFDGIQHFQPVEIFGGEKEFIVRQHHDKMKDEYCVNNNIRLIRIKYNDTIKIDDLI